MQKHESITVVAWLPGQPLSQVEADLGLQGFDQLTTPVEHTADGIVGLACKVNLIDEATALEADLIDAGFNACLAGRHYKPGWSIRADQ